MGTLRLRSWPFPENSEVELVWFGSPFIDYKGNWRIRVAFRMHSGQLKVISYPWGTVPYLRLGQIYKDGLYDQIKPMDGIIHRLSIASLCQGEIVTGFKLPKRLIDFGKNPELGLQKIVQFQSSQYIYCIPLFDLIRAMFINSRYLAYYLMQPHGMDMLVDRSELRGDTLYFDLTTRVPASLASESSARHLSWVYMSPEIRSMWDSVYNLLMRQAIREMPHNPSAKLKKGIPIEVELPDVGQIEMHVRGVQFIDYILVKEVVAIGGFKHPAKEITFWHPSKKHRQSIWGDKQVRVTSRSPKDDLILNENSENSKEDTNQDVIETPPTFMRFSNYPKVTTRREDIRHTNTGNEIVVTSGWGGKSSGGLEQVSTQDSVVGGDTPPIDFQTLETIPITEAIGLESFFQMIQFLKHSFSYNIRMSVVRVPPGKRFSVCPNGARRTCAIVQISSAISTAYILEIARPDDWSISTLILHPTKIVSTLDVEHAIKLLLDGLVQKSGHWDQNVLNRCNESVIIKKIKHYKSDSIKDWSAKLLNKLQLF